MMQCLSISCENSHANNTASLPHENCFAKVKNSCVRSAYYSIDDDYDVNAYEIWINGDGFYTTVYACFGDGWKTTQWSLHDG